MSYEYSKPSALVRAGLEGYKKLYGQSVLEMDAMLAKVPPHPNQIDLTHGDTTAFLPPASAFLDFAKAVEKNTEAYSAYRGSSTVRNVLAPRLTNLLEVEVDPVTEVIITPGTQGALYSALSSLVGPGTLVAFPATEYFMNERIVSYLGGESIRIPTFISEDGYIEIEESNLLRASSHGASVFVFSNPNNPTGGIYSRKMCEKLAVWAKNSAIAVIVDQLYCRLIYDGRDFTNFCGLPGMRDQTITLLGPSKTESMSGFRVGIAVAPLKLINSMESVLSMTSLRTAGYAQHALTHWLDKDEEWLTERIQLHQVIRDYLVLGLSEIPGVKVTVPAGSSYVFPDFSKVESVNHNNYDDDFVLTKDLKLAGVLVSPGYQSGIHGRGHFRINFSQHFDSIKLAVDRIRSLVQN